MDVLMLKASFSIKTSMSEHSQPIGEGQVLVLDLESQDLIKLTSVTERNCILTARQSFQVRGT